MKAPGLIILLLLFTFPLISNAQEILTARIVDKNTFQPLVGANIYTNDSRTGTIADNRGFFSITVPTLSTQIVISHVGYESLKFKAGDFENIAQFVDDELLIQMKTVVLAFNDEAVVVGSRNYSRTVTSSPVPVDNFPEAVLESTGQSDLSQQLNRIAPSFYSTRLTYSDATDHMDPASLRGMNPDQTLILVNGKRHHPAAVVNTLGVVGRGSVINDLNTIPASAIERVEVLRDGASAQYGSDAIAGVINIVLKDSPQGGFVTTQVGQTYEGDGLQTNFGANYGFGFKNGTRVNISAEYRKRGSTNRAGIYEGLIYSVDEPDDGISFEEHLANDNQILEDRGLTREDFRMQLGNSEMENRTVYLNINIPLNERFSLYAFGGLNNRFSKSAGDYRLPNDPDRSNLAMYPDGFLPSVEAELRDQFVSTGLTGEIMTWDFDLSNTLGSNSIEYFVNNSTNASMGADSPTSFESGRIRYFQNTVNLDFSRDFGNYMLFDNFIVAFGSEFRLENYRIFAGEEASWINEDQVSFPGAQGYPGYQPSDEVDATRNNIGVYLDIFTKFNDRFSVSTAGRFENYSDFGSNLSGKLAAKYSLASWLNLRGSVSSGFRAPALHQSYYSYTGSYYFGGILYEILTAPNSSEIARSFGIPSLKEETSVNYSFGITSRPGSNTVFTADVYQVDVKDRVVLSGFFYKYFGNTVIDSLLADLTSVGGAQFFTNAIDTRSRGIDIVFSQDFNLTGSRLGFSVGLNLNETEIVGDLNSSDQILENNLEEQLFDRQSRALIELAQPKSKINLALNYRLNAFSVNIKTIRFGEVSYRGITEGEQDQDYSPKWVTDLRLDYRFHRLLSIYIGAQNIFDVYPDGNNETLKNYGRFVYNTAVTQFGFNGGFYYAGLKLDI
ncbi:MAG: TonB-dependent receptor [Bacteroidales bacterium]